MNANFQTNVAIEKEGLVPQRDFNIAGEDWTEEYRLRPGLFGAVLEQLVVTREGERKWKRTSWPVTISTPNR